jgi:hypothetical protein
MPANEFNNFTEHDVGIGLRVPDYHHILTRKPVVDWFEIISENFMIDAVSMYFGSAEKADRAALGWFRRPENPTASKPESSGSRNDEI